MIESEAAFDEGVKMNLDGSRHARSYILLCSALVVVSVVFGVPASYSRSVYFAVAGIQFLAIGLGAWKLGLWAIMSEADVTRKLAVAGGFFVMPSALFSFLAGFGRPDQATHAQNQLRYIVLLISAMAVAGGFVLLRDALRGAGEPFYSTLAFSAIILATPLYLVWATILIEVHHARALLNSGEVQPVLNTLAEMSDILLFFGGALTYLATAACAMSIARVNWLTRKAANALVVVSLVAFACLLVRGLEFPDPRVVFTHAYTIPGYVAGIPAVPWIMPCLIGVLILKRAGSASPDSIQSRIGG